MRVLWFINIPTAEAAEYLGYPGLNIGGWFEALKNELRKNSEIKLSIAFSWGDDTYKEFIIDSIQYYKLPYLKPTKGLRGRIANLTHQLEPLKVVDFCLEAVEDFKPDIIHIFGTERNYGLMIEITNIPCVIHIQGILNKITDKYFSGISISDIILNGYKKRLLSGNSLLHLYFLMKKQSKRELEIFKICKYFMGRTEWDKNVVKEYSKDAKYFQCDEIIRDEFNNRGWIPNDNKIMRIYSTLGPQNYKGIESLAQASLIINKEKKINTLFNVGGLSENDEVFKIVIKKHGSEIKKYLKPLGRLAPPLIVKEMLISDVYVHPSHIDNSPNSVCEAMMLGMPIVSTDVGGIPSLIENGVDGLLVPPGNANSMTEAIFRIINDRVLADKLSKNARMRAAERHDKEKIVKKLFEIYNDVVNNA